MKNPAIQLVRAISIIAVVMIHTTPSGMCQVICKPFINFAVATFLFLSGYLTEAQCNNWRLFYRKRIIRVIVPYIIWTVICSLRDVGAYGAGIIIKNLVSANASVTLYYIFVYIQFVLLTPAMIKLVKSKYRHFGWLLSPLSVLVFQYHELFTGNALNKYVSMLWSILCLGWFTFYYLGLMLGNQYLTPKYSLKGLIIVYAAAIVFQMTEGYIWYLLGDVKCGSQLKLTSLMTSSIFILIIYNILNNGLFHIRSRLFEWIGDSSFGIYLSHMMVIHLLKKCSFYILIPYPLNSVAVIFVSLVFCELMVWLLGINICRWLGLR